MGIRDISLSPLFSFIYHIEFENSLSEHEFDHVLIGTYNNDIQINTEEVEEFLWMYPEEINEWVTLNPEKFTYWFKLILS
jgi:isopentenyl-diphosphate delta-isomerase